MACFFRHNKIFEVSVVRIVVWITYPVTLPFAANRCVPVV